jgi:hypothetical protein
MIAKQHRIKLKFPATQANVINLNESLSEFDQIAKAELDENPIYITIRYDLNRLSFNQILKKIQSLGLQMNHSFCWRLIYWIWQFTEENERDNMSGPPSPCCSNPQSILSKAKRS